MQPHFTVTRSLSIAVLFLALAVTCVPPSGFVCALEATWTPNPEDEDGGGPLPQSSRQRQQLVQLENAIRNSPDPAATLKHVAATKGLSPQDLASMLERNRRDVEMTGAAVQQQKPRKHLPNVLWKALTTVTAVAALVLVSLTNNVVSRQGGAEEGLGGHHKVK